MTLSIAELLFEDATLKNNQPLPETSSEDFTVNQAFLNSLKKTVSSKIFSKLPEAKLVKKAIDEIKSVDSQEEKDKIQKQVESIISDPLGAFSKQDLMRIAISATSVSRLGPVVFDVAQMKTGKDQVKGFTGIDLQLMKSTQIIPFLVMTKEGEVLSGENNRKGSFGYAFLAPAYYAKIEEKNIPVYEELFPGLLENHIINGEESKFAANVENLELPVVPIDSEILKFVQQAFKNQKTLPALVQKLQTTYRSTMQNIVRDEEEKGDSPAERQSQEELNAGLFENNSLVYKQGIKSLLVENNKIDTTTLTDIVNKIAVGWKLTNDDHDKYHSLFEELRSNTTLTLWQTVFVSHNTYFYYVEEKEKYKTALADGSANSLNSRDRDHYKNVIKNYNSTKKTIEKRAKSLREIEDYKLVIKTIEASQIVQTHSISLTSLSSRPRVLASDNIKHFLKEHFNNDQAIEDLAHYLVYISSGNNDALGNLKIIKENVLGKLKDISLFGLHLVLNPFLKGGQNKISKKLADHLRVLLFFGFYDPVKSLRASNFINNMNDEYKKEQEESDDLEQDKDESSSQMPAEEESKSAQSKSKPKPPSPTDFKGRLENAARELERSLSLIVNRQEQSEETGTVIARNLFSRLSDNTYNAFTSAVGDDDLTALQMRSLVMFGREGEEAAYKSLYDNFVAILAKERENLNVVLGEEAQNSATGLGLEDFNSNQKIPGNLYFSLLNNKIPQVIEKAIADGAKEITQSDDDVSSQTENLETFKERVNTVCQTFSNSLRKVNVGSSSTQRSLVLKNKPILNFVARKIREEGKSYEDFFEVLLTGRSDNQLADILKHFSFSPMFDFDGKLIDNLFKGIEKNMDAVGVKNLIQHLLTKKIDEDISSTENILSEVLNSLFDDNEAKVNEIISGSQEYKDQCELFYGVEPSEEEAKDSQLEELCKSISRKLLEAEDEKAYNEKRREAQEKYEKEMLDAKKEQVRKEGFRFGFGAAASLTVGVIGAVATGGLGAVALATAGILGMPVGALIGHSTVGLGPVQKDEVNKSDLTKAIDDLAKENLKGLDASIIEALKNAKIVEGIYVHERSLTELLFELKDFDVIGKKSRKKEIKKREIKRKDFEDILTRNKVLMYDSKYASSPADISAVRNEFIESLNLLLSYYYNATIENVKQATSSAEVKAVTLKTALFNRIQALNDESGEGGVAQVIKEIEEAAKEYRIEFPSDSVREARALLSDPENADLSSITEEMSYTFDVDDLAAFEDDDESGDEPQPAQSADEPETQTKVKDGDSKTSSNEYLDNLSVDTKGLNDFIDSKDVFKVLGINSEEVFKNELLYCFKDLGNLLCPVVSYVQDKRYIVGFVHKGKFRFVHAPQSKDENNYAVREVNANQIKTNRFNYTTFIDLQNNIGNQFYIITGDLSNSEDYNETVVDFLQKFLEENKNPVRARLFRRLTDDKGKLTLESKLNKSSSDYILGSLTNLLFESSNKEDLSVVKRVYNKSDSVNSSSLEKEWRRLWNIYK